MEERTNRKKNLRLCALGISFDFFSQYNFEFQAFLKFCDAAGSKFRSIAKRLRLVVIAGESHEAHENVSSIDQQIQVHILLHFRSLSVCSCWLPFCGLC